jgi:hypothetical protein
MHIFGIIQAQTKGNAKMNIVDLMIEKDYQNTLLDQYERETGKEAVPECGGHTDGFETWFVNKCLDAEDNGCTTAEDALEYIKANEVKFCEVDFGEETDANRIAIKYRGETPTVERVSEWCRKDERMFGHKVTSVHPADRKDVEPFYDFSRESDWPVFSQSK